MLDLEPRAADVGAERQEPCHHRAQPGRSPHHGGLTFGKLSKGRQTCVALDYVLVHRDDLDGFVAEYGALLSRWADEPQLYRDHQRPACRAPERLAGRWTRQGCRGHLRRPPPRQCREPPPDHCAHAVLNAGGDCAVMQDEIFGPILPVQTHATMDDAIAHVNPCPEARLSLSFAHGSCAASRGCTLPAPDRIALPVRHWLASSPISRVRANSALSCDGVGSAPRCWIDAIRPMLPRSWPRGLRIGAAMALMPSSDSSGAVA